jgi:hypothetical protein
MVDLSCTQAEQLDKSRAVCVYIVACPSHSIVQKVWQTNNQCDNKTAENVDVYTGSLRVLHIPVLLSLMKNINDKCKNIISLFWNQSHMIKEATIMHHCFHYHSLHLPSSTTASSKVNTIDFFKADMNWWFMHIYKTSLQRVHVASRCLIGAANSRSSWMTAKNQQLIKGFLY